MQYWVSKMALWGSPPQGNPFSPTQLQPFLGDSTVIGNNPILADYGPFISGTSSSGWQEAFDEIMAANASPNVIILAGAYSGGNLAFNTQTDVSSPLTITALGSITYTNTKVSSSSLGPVFYYAGVNNQQELQLNGSINFVGNGYETGGLIVVNSLLRQTGSLQLSNMAGWGFVQIGGPYGATIDHIGLNIITPLYTSTSWAPPMNVVTYAGFYMNGVDNVPTYSGVTVIGRPQYLVRSLQVNSSIGTTSTGIYVSDTNNISFNMIQGGYQYGAIFYNPFADNYTNIYMNIQPGDNATTCAVYLYFTGYGEGGTTGSSTATFTVTGSVGGAAPVIQNTGFTLVNSGQYYTASV